MLVTVAALTLALSQGPLQLPSDNPDEVDYAFPHGMRVACLRVQNPAPQGLPWSCTSSLFTGHASVEPVKLRRNTDREIRLMRPIGSMTPTPLD
jgi:hypothetical protein